MAVSATRTRGTRAVRGALPSKKKEMRRMGEIRAIGVRRTDGDISAALLMKNYSSRTVCRDLLRSRNFLSGHSSPATLMDDIFIRLLTLTSRLSHRFIRFIEDLVYRDAERRPQHSQFPFNVLHQAASCHTHQAVTDNCSSSLSNSDACVCLCNSDRRESDQHRHVQFGSVWRTFPRTKPN